MFVPAPRRNSNGTTSLTTQVLNRAGASGEATLANALAKAYVMNQTNNTPLASTTRASMQPGILGYKRYKDTDYSCSYKVHRRAGTQVTVHKQGALYYSTANNLRTGGLGPFNNGFDEYLIDVAISGSSPSAEAIYNKIVLGNMENRAKAECLKKASDMQFDLAESLAGLSQTVEMVADLTIRCLRAAIAVRRGDFTYAVGILGLAKDQVKRMRGRDAADAWLQIQYGWLPLMSDIHSGIELVNSMLSKTSNPAPLSVVRRVSESLALRPLSTSGSVWQKLDFVTRAEAGVEVRYRFGMKDADLHFLSSLGFSNPAYIAWVAVPWSFVIDWFVPVGTWLQALSAPLGLQFHSGYVTTKTFGSAQVTGWSKSTGIYPKVVEFGASTAACEAVNMRRVSLTSFPLARLYFRIPSLNNVVNASALVNSSRKYR